MPISLLAATRLPEEGHPARPGPFLALFHATLHCHSSVLTLYVRLHYGPGMRKKREELVQVRASGQEKEFWNRSATDQGLPLSTWMRMVANQAAKMIGVISGDEDEHED